MPEPSWLSIPLGLALLVLGLLDVFLTVLHVQVESPISNRLNRQLWRLLLTITRPLPRPLRDDALAWGLPLMIVTDIGFWILLAVAGFALLYLPLLSDPASFTLTEARTAWPLVDALYFSGASFFTLGYGDIAPLHPLARLLAVLEGAAGLLTLSLAVTYLLSVYPFITRKTALAAALNQETAGRADGVVTAQRYLAADRFDALAERLRWINDELLALGQAHGLYPVLFYVRPRIVHESFIRALAVTQGLVGTLRYATDTRAHPEIASDPRLIMLEEGLLYTLHNLQRSSHLAGSPSDVSVDGDGPGGACFGEALDSQRVRLGLAAAPERPEDAAARASFRRFRQATDPIICTYAAAVDYDPRDVWATYNRWARDSALEPGPDAQPRTPGIHNMSETS